MAKQKQQEQKYDSHGLLTLENFPTLQDQEESINSIKNCSHTGAALNFLKDEEEKRITDFIVKTVRAVLIVRPSLEKKIISMDKPDKNKNHRMEGKVMGFTKDPYYSDELAEQLEGMAEAYNNLVGAYDLALREGTEKNWENVEAKVKAAKKYV